MRRSSPALRQQDPGPYARHLPALDGLRGLAVLGVMGSHLFPGGNIGKGILVNASQHLLMYGATGVDLFFVLSGFLITGILYDSVHDSGYFRKFYARRALRIFPLYYGVLCLLLLLTPLLHVQWHGMQWSLLLYLQNTNWPMPLYAFYPEHGINVSHLWSLAVEEQFYIVWPLLVFLIRRIKPLLWTCLLLSLAALFIRTGLAFTHIDIKLINVMTLCRMDSLLCGAALALGLRTHYHDVILRWSRPAFFFFAVIAATIVIAQDILSTRPEFLTAFNLLLVTRYSLLAIASTALIAWCLRPASSISNAFKSATLRFFGRYSYGLYVLHALFISYFLTLFRGWSHHLSSSKGVAVVISGVLLLLLSIIAAYATYNLYEVQFLRLKSRFNYDRRAAGKTQPILVHGT
jgi:peptidoglycan/LPS O-acetylase OafA/YrhL